MDRPGGRDARSPLVECPPVEYDPNAQVYRVSFSPSGPEAVHELVVASVAAIEDVEPTVLPPVHDVVDPEAVDRLLTSASREPTREDVVVAFTYAGSRVSVSPGEVRVKPIGEDDD